MSNQNDPKQEPPRIQDTNAGTRGRETTLMSVSSNLAALLLKKGGEKGRSVEIPSLGIKIQRKE